MILSLIKYRIVGSSGGNGWTNTFSTLPLAFNNDNNQNSVGEIVRLGIGGEGSFSHDMGDAMLW